MNPDPVYWVAVIIQYIIQHTTLFHASQGKAAALTEHRLFSADEVNVATLAAAGATLLSPFPGEERPGVKVDLRAREAQ